MTAKDRWAVNLSCPKCPATGVARLWQEDGWSFSNGDRSTHIDDVSGGFVAQQEKGSFRVDFSCACGEKAIQS